MIDEIPRRFGAAVALSIAAHAAAAWLLVVAPSVLPTADAGLQAQEFSIEVIEEPVEPSPPVERAPEPRPDEAPRPEPERERTRERRVVPERGAVVTLPRPGETVAPEPPTTIAPPETAPTEPPRGPSDEERRRQWETLLNPEAVARGAFTFDGPGPAQRRGPQSGVSIGGPPAMGEREAERALSGHLRERAMARPWLARQEPRLVPRPDGSQVYQGHAFTATIRPDGSIVYDDRPGITTDGFSTSGSFDLGDVMMRAQGADPYAAERLWFEEHTEALRAQMEARWRHEAMQRALGRLPGQLQALWQRESRPAEQRRRQIFEIWDDCAPGEAGEAARRTIERWIREHLPQDGPDAFTPEEIARLNRSRRSDVEFAPYRERP